MNSLVYAKWCLHPWCCYDKLIIKGEDGARLSVPASAKKLQFLYKHRNISLRPIFRIFPLLLPIFDFLGIHLYFFNVLVTQKFDLEGGISLETL